MIKRIARKINPGSVILTLILVLTIIVSISAERISERSLQNTKESLINAQESLINAQDALASVMFFKLTGEYVQIVSRVDGEEQKPPYTIHYTLDVGGETRYGDCVFGESEDKCFLLGGNK